MLSHCLLIIDDESAQREALAGFLRKKGYETETAASGKEGLNILKQKAIDLVITDFKMPGMDGLEFLEYAKNINPDTDIVVMTAYGSIEGATRALKEGAIDYITKPIDLDELELTLSKALDHKQLVSENKELREQLADKFSFKGIISVSGSMENAINIAGRSAASKATILITGESGTGKELIAKAIHFASPRKDKAFVAVNVTALSENLLESELFGHEKGAFTGADRNRKGRFELATGGTLFIDEVGDMALSTQVKLLRVLQERVIERVGGSEHIPIDVRIVAATNHILEDLVKQGTFRNDLFYRLNVVRIQLPPLRDRKEDIPLLVNHFLHKFAEENQKQISNISKEAMDLLYKYDYPGNIRELENIIAQAVILSRYDIITTNDLPITVRGLNSDDGATQTPTSGSFKDKVEWYEKQLLTEALNSSNGNQTKAAKLLGMTERHLRYKLQKYVMKVKK